MLSSRWLRRRVDSSPVQRATMSPIAHDKWLCQPNGFSMPFFCLLTVGGISAPNRPFLILPHKPRAYIFGDDNLAILFRISPPSSPFKPVSCSVSFHLPHTSQAHSRSSPKKIYLIDRPPSKRIVHREQIRRARRQRHKTNVLIVRGAQWVICIIY